MRGEGYKDRNNNKNKREERVVAGLGRDIEYLRVMYRRVLESRLREEGLSYLDRERIKLYIWSLS